MTKQPKGDRAIALAYAAMAYAFLTRARFLGDTDPSRTDLLVLLQHITKCLYRGCWEVCGRSVIP